MTRPDCQPIHDDLADLVAGDSGAIARHSEHLASCDDCRDARHEATQLVAQLPNAGADYVLPADFLDRVMAKVTDDTAAAPPASKPVQHDAPIPIAAAPRKRARSWMAFGAIAALAAGGVGIYQLTRSPSNTPGTTTVADGQIGVIKTIERASKDRAGGLEVRDGSAWRVVSANDKLAAGAERRADERTRATIELADGTRFTLDHKTQLALPVGWNTGEYGVDGNRTPREATLVAGRVVADVADVRNRPATIHTPTGRVDVVGTKFALTATATVTVVQVVRGAVVLAATAGGKDEVRAGEEGMIENGTLAVNAAPGLARELEWSELGPKNKDTEAGAGLGALRAYKPGEKRDRDWNLALANHDVKVRIVGPIARTEITETFRNDSDQTLEGVYQFPLPADAQIDALALDVKDAPGGFEQGAFVDKERAQKIWKGVIDKAAPRKLEIAQNEIIWVEGSWRDPALLDWKRGGRFELRIFPIPAKGARTIKIAYTQVVTPRGPWRQYVYPLPHSADGSTVADKLTVDVEVRGSMPGQVRTAGYQLAADPKRTDVSGLTLEQTGFVPRGDLVVDYRAAEGDAELRAWSYAGNFAVAPDEKLAAKQNVGNDAKVIAEQRAVAADSRPTAVIALRPKLPRWRAEKARDYMIVIDTSQSMVGERATRAGELATRMIEQMDRRDRVSVMACDSECRKLGALRVPSIGATKDLATFLAAQAPAGASDLVAAVRTAAADLTDPTHERWVVFVGDGFASTGFRKAGDVEQAIAASTKGINVTTIGIGSDADAALLSAAARGGGGSYVAWVPGQSVKSAAIAGIESTFGTALRDATITLPSGLADVAPTVLPTIRGGDEVLVAARVTGKVAGDVVVKGTISGQPFEQRYPLTLTVSTAAGNGFVPRLWAALAIEQIEQKGGGELRPRIVALSQGYGVMSKETSLLVLESPAMFDAFGIDRGVPAAKWTGQESLDEVIASGTIGHDAGMGDDRSGAGRAKDSDRQAPAKSADAGESISLDATDAKKAPRSAPRPAMDPPANVGRTRGGMFAMRRTWVRVPSVSAYDSISPSITKAIGDAERALAKSPDSRERHRALVQALAYAGELDRANVLAAKWLDRDRLDPQALGYQADLLGRDGKREIALRMLAGVVDLDADRKEPHERMALAYEHVGRLAQACSHRIALSMIAPKDAKAGAAAIRCLRGLSLDGDATLVQRDLADDATRTAADKELASPAASSPKQDLVIDARWEGGDDLDVSLVTPDGTRVSWMGGRSDVRVTDATNTAKERLALASLKRGNYLVEVGRGGLTAGTGTARGTLDIVVLGTKKSLPFELGNGQARKIVGRVSVNLEERIESIDPAATRISLGNISNANARRVILARSPSLQQCFTQYMMQNPGTSGRMVLTVTVEPGGSTSTRATASPALVGPARCVEGQLSSMHVEGSGAGSFRVPLAFSSP
ncbi:MAG: FecR domain-containing protein [Kofleriaceae bacterium]